LLGRRSLPDVLAKGKLRFDRGREFGASATIES